MPAYLLFEEDQPGIPDLKKLVEGIEFALQLAFPKGTPHLILLVLGYVLLILIALGLVWTALWLASKIKKLWAEEIKPVFYNADQARRARRRRLFARYLKNEILTLNSKEEWGDHRFAELEAAVEAEGLCRGGLFPFLARFASTRIRRERSLSKAIEASAERLIMVEGEPGAGKSVALRHVALNMADRAEHSSGENGILPVYVNLKELKSSPLESRPARGFSFSTHSMRYRKY